MKKRLVLIGILLILVIGTIVCIIAEAKKETPLRFVQLLGGRRITMDKTGPNRLLLLSGRKVRVYGFDVMEKQLAQTIKLELIGPKWVRQGRSDLYINIETDEAVRIIRLPDLEEKYDFQSIVMISRRPTWVEQLLDRVFP